MIWWIASLWPHSTEAFLRAGTFLAVLLPASLCLGTNSCLASKPLPWSVPLSLPAFPGLVVQVWECGKACLRPTCYSIFSTSPSQAFVSEKSVLKYWSTFSVLLLTDRSTATVPHLWTASRRQESLSSIPLDREFVFRSTISKRHSGQTVTLSLWQLSRNF